MPDQKLPAAPKAARPKSATATPLAFDWRDALVVIRSHLPVSAAIALVACTVLFWQQMRQPRLYQTSASVQITRGERERALELRASDFEATMELAIQTQLQQLRSTELIDQVAASLVGAEREKIAEVPTPSDRHLTAAIRRTLSFERSVGTALISINAIHRDPAAAALLANRYAEVAIKYTAERARRTGEASVAFLREQAEEARRKSEAAERELQEYRQKYDLVSLEANQNIIVDNLKSLNASATAARVARVGIEARLDQAESVLGRGGDPAQIAAIAASEALEDAGRRLADLRGKRAVMAQRYGRRHPVMQENERAIQAVEKLQAEELATALASLRNQRDRAMEEERQLGEQLANAEKDALRLDQLGVEYNILRRSVETFRASHSQMLARLNDVTISTQLDGAQMKVSELAGTPATPFSPDMRRAMIVCIGLACSILLGYPFAAELFFGRVRSANDVEYHLGADLLGEIGSVRRISEKDRPRLVGMERDEAAGEQFRALYSQLTLTTKIDPPKTILVTSTVPGEGKSFIAANLAACFVAHSRRTLLIDGDFRRPTQHRNFGVDNKNGIIRWLEEDGRLDGELLRNEKLGILEISPGLFLLRAGGVSRKSTELLDAPQLPALLKALQRHFDVVMIDTPPAGVFPDAIAFAKTCHELVYVCRFNTVARRAVRDVLARLRQTELEFSGVILNAMPAGFGGSYYYRGYSYQQARRYAKDYAAS